MTALDLQPTRTGGAFAVGMLGDREEFVVERITDEGWGLVRSTDRGVENHR